MDEFGYFLAAYIVAWVVVFGFVLWNFILQRNMKREIDSLKHEVKSKKLD